jgi:hypothetical protein
MDMFGGFIRAYLLGSLKDIIRERYVVLTNMKEFYFIKPGEEEFVTMIGDVQLKLDDHLIDHMEIASKADSQFRVFGADSIDDVLDGYNYVKQLCATHGA